jgi:CHAD domain-containing protein
VSRQLSSPAKNSAIPQNLMHLRAMTVALKDELKQCADDPKVETVHRVRTGTRRVQAMLETVLREVATPNDPNAVSGLADTGEKWTRLLKRIRRAAAPVRDLDVHRQLLEDLVSRKSSSATDDRRDAPAGEEAAAAATPAEPELILNLETTAPVAPAGNQAEPSPVQKQADELDAWLKHARQQQAGALSRTASKALEKFETREIEFETLLAQSPKRRRSTRSAAVIALESFVRLADTMERLDADNLHDFRKGAKKARYIAESGGDEEQATAVGKALKKLQDEIGEWHDWLVLADEARAALGDQGAELIQTLDAERDRHYDRAMKTTARLRGKLMGEWLATQQRPRRASNPRQPAKHGSAIRLSAPRLPVRSKPRSNN